jgi:hypothetical protein
MPENMKKLSFLISSVLLVSVYHPVIYCQQPDFIRGKVIHSRTSEPVSFAAVHLKNSQFGIYTNAEGDFRIFNDPKFQSDSLIVTCIGFHKLSLAFGTLKTTGLNNLRLIPNIYGLNEVKVIARKKRLNSEAIVARAIRNIKKNYPVTPFSYVSYYRDYQKDSINYLNLNEAIIQTLDEGFASPSDSNRYRLLDFRKNTDFLQENITPYYDLPETDHSDMWFKRIPHAIVGDQYGNEFFILLVHDAIRNFEKRSFSFVNILTQDFVINHWFSNPTGIYDESTLLYKIDFTGKPRIIGDSIQVKGAIFIQPEDFSIHKLEYSAYSKEDDKEIFNIETEYGHGQAHNSRMCLKYISFNNSFSIPDSSDNNFFKIEKSEWRHSGGPYADYPFPDMTFITFFNRRIDPLSARVMGNFDMTIGKRKAKITKLKVDGANLFITVRDDKFNPRELDSCHLSIKTLKDINGNILNNRKNREFRQFRELFVQEYNKQLESKDTCYIRAIPLEQNCIFSYANSGRFWMNSPLKSEEKQQDIQNK